uniref:Uncharacterized protein n=1 Tax=Oryza nivara TaxID=4536 RepID=A0A0E0HCU5_ORYNI
MEMLHTIIPSGRDPFCPLEYSKRSPAASAGHGAAPVCTHGRHGRRRCNTHARTVDTLPRDHELLVGGTGCGAHTRTIDALPRDRELLVGGAGAGVGEEEPSADAVQMRK